MRITTNKQYYRRYTDLTSLVNILQKRELTLLDPQTWEDKNDSYYLSIYKSKCNLKSVLALCFSLSNETFHHWRVFSPGPSGVCIKFDANALDKSINSVIDVKMKSIEYLTLTELKKNRIKKEKLPFIKRSQFKPENEIRLLWESKDKDVSTFSIPFEINSILRITLSPWLHPALSDGIKKIIKSIKYCEKLKIYRSTIINNADWVKYGDKVN